MDYGERCKFLLATCQVGRDWKDPSQSLLWREIELFQEGSCEKFLGVGGGGGARGFATDSLVLDAHWSGDGDVAARVIGQCRRLHRLRIAVDFDQVFKVLQVSSLSGMFIFPSAQVRVGSDHSTSDPCKLSLHADLSELSVFLGPAKSNLSPSTVTLPFQLKRVRIHALQVASFDVALFSALLLPHVTQASLELAPDSIRTLAPTLNLCAPNLTKWRPHRRSHCIPQTLHLAQALRYRLPGRIRMDR